VLAIASHPAFDPNRFTRGIRGEEWRELLDHPRRPLTDRAIQGQYPPGSTFKIVMATAALEEGVINPFTHIHCSGQMHYGQRDFRCWRKGGHGTVDLHNALVQSCDVFFYQVGQRLGIDTIAEYARSFGLGVTTGIKLEHEKSGTMPDSAWKRKRFKQPWFAGETLSVAIGQGYVTATPLQMAQAVATLATGIRYRPHLVKSILAPDDSVVQTFEPEELGRVPARPFVLEQVREGVRDVVNAPNGTGKKAALRDVTVAGKTGTAQVVTLGKERKKPQQMPWNERDHAWFIAYAPFEEPEIAVATLVEHADGGGGAVAAPIAHTVLEAYFDLQSKKEPARYAEN
jgi:penicillin-binding protein 2